MLTYFVPSVWMYSPYPIAWPFSQLPMYTSPSEWISLPIPWAKLFIQYPSYILILINVRKVEEKSNNCKILFIRMFTKTICLFHQELTGCLYDFFNWKLFYLCLLYLSMFHSPRYLLTFLVLLSTCTYFDCFKNLLSWSTYKYTVSGVC